MGSNVSYTYPVLIEELLASKAQKLVLVLHNTAMTHIAAEELIHRLGSAWYQKLSYDAVVMADAREFHFVSCFERPHTFFKDAAEGSVSVAIDTACPFDKAHLWRDAMKSLKIRETEEGIV